MKTIDQRTYIEAVVAFCDAVGVDPIRTSEMRVGTDRLVATAPGRDFPRVELEVRA